MSVQPQQVALSLLAMVGVLGCFAPRFGEGQFECGPGGECPTGLVCQAERCVSGTAGRDLGPAEDLRPAADEPGEDGSAAQDRPTPRDGADGGLPDAALDLAGDARPDVPLADQPAEDGGPLPDGNPGPDVRVLVNLLGNPSFEEQGAEWPKPWYLNVGGTAMAALFESLDGPADGAFSARVEVYELSSEEWHLQLSQGGIPVEEGRTYTLSFQARASGERSITPLLQQDHDPYQVFAGDTAALGPDWQSFSLSTVVPFADTAVVSFNLGQATGEVWIDAVSLTVE